MTGFARADIRALYVRDWVALEGPDTHGIMKRAASPKEFRRGLQAVNWDEFRQTNIAGCRSLRHQLCIGEVYATWNAALACFQWVQIGGNTPLSRTEFPFAGSTLRPRANVTTALPPWRPSVSKEIQLQRGGVPVKGLDSI
jgi:hypothetical protein